MSVQGTQEYLANLIVDRGSVTVAQARALAGAILTDPGLELVRVCQDAPSYVEPQVGQVWKTKDTQRLRVITAVTDSVTARVRWTALDGVHPRAGSAHKHYWDARNTFVNHGRKEDT